MSSVFELRERAVKTTLLQQCHLSLSCVRGLWRLHSFSSVICPWAAWEGCEDYTPSAVSSVLELRERAVMTALLQQCHLSLSYVRGLWRLHSFSSVICPWAAWEGCEDYTPSAVSSVLELRERAVKTTLLQQCHLSLSCVKGLWRLHSFSSVICPWATWEGCEDYTPSAVSSVLELRERAVKTTLLQQCHLSLSCVRGLWRLHSFSSVICLWAAWEGCEDYTPAAVSSVFKLRERAMKTTLLQQCHLSLSCVRGLWRLHSFSSVICPWAAWEGCEDYTPSAVSSVLELRERAVKTTLLQQCHLSLSCVRGLWRLHSFSSVICPWAAWEGCEEYTPSAVSSVLELRERAVKTTLLQQCHLSLSCVRGLWRLHSFSSVICPWAAWEGCEDYTPSAVSSVLELRGRAVKITLLQQCHLSLSCVRGLWRLHSFSSVICPWAAWEGCEDYTPSAVSSVFELRERAVKTTLLQQCHLSLSYVRGLWRLHSFSSVICPWAAWEGCEDYTPSAVSSVFELRERAVKTTLLQQCHLSLSYVRGLWRLHSFSSVICPWAAWEGCEDYTPSAVSSVLELRERAVKTTLLQQCHLSLSNVRGLWRLHSFSSVICPWAAWEGCEDYTLSAVSSVLELRERAVKTTLLQQCHLSLSCVRGLWRLHSFSSVICLWAAWEGCEDYTPSAVSYVLELRERAVKTTLLQQCHLSLSCVRGLWRLHSFSSVICPWAAWEGCEDYTPSAVSSVLEQRERAVKTTLLQQCHLSLSCVRGLWRLHSFSSVICPWAAWEGCEDYTPSAVSSVLELRERAVKTTLFQQCHLSLSYVRGLWRLHSFSSVICPWAAWEGWEDYTPSAVSSVLELRERALFQSNERHALNVARRDSNMAEIKFSAKNSRSELFF